MGTISSMLQTPTSAHQAYHVAAFFVCLPLLSRCTRDAAIQTCAAPVQQPLWKRPQPPCRKEERRIPVKKRIMRKKNLKAILLAASMIAAACVTPQAAMAAETGTEATVTAETQQSTESETPAPTPETTPETQPATPTPETPAPETPAPTPETQPETTPETQPETQPETPAETTPETQPETTPETTPETQPETTPETAPETGNTEAETETAPATEAETEKGTEKTDKNKPKKETEKKQTAETARETEAATENTVQIQGFSVDPSQYPPVDVNETTDVMYQYLRMEMGLNHAAAAGVLANAQCESAFNTFSLGDGGTSYGLLQWHAGRFNSLISYCNSNGLDYNTAKGQLAYMEHELETGYRSVLEYIRNVPDTEQGAYDAAYYWCMHFELPADTVNQSIRRGNLAKDYFHRDFSMAVNAKDRLEKIEETVEKAMEEFNETSVDEDEETSRADLSRQAPR